MLLAIPLRFFSVGQAFCRQPGIFKEIENPVVDLKFSCSIWSEHTWQGAMLGPFLPDAKGIEQVK